MMSAETNGAQATDPPVRVALVTGAASGLGAATVEVFREAGFAVAALDIRASDPPASDANPESLAWWQVDISDERQVARVIAEVANHFGRIDAAINCAGIDHTYWIEQLTVGQFDQILAVNLRGPFLIAKAIWPVMRARGGGHIVNVASTAGVRAWSGASAYHASKFGLIGMGRGLGIEGRPDNIRVTTVIPGGMDTHFFERFAGQGIPLPDPESLQNPLDVARSILFATTMSPGSVIQELVVTPPNEPSWP
jgi:NAD(P)-dependent dehydrogenase (short-subunit alcohol dehydrogenase family)